jgi:putative sigma-54 modulation protein
MKSQVRFHGVETSESLREYAARRIHLHLSRFGRDLTVVVVRIADVNGPKGGRDKRCRVSVRGPRIGSTTLDEYSGDFWSAVDLALERAAQKVGRALEKARSLTRSQRTVS